MPNTALILNARTRLFLLDEVVDGWPDTEHELETMVGDEVLEDNAEITDHAIALQEKVTVTGWVSNMTGGNRPAIAWAAVRKVWGARPPRPIQVITEWGVYDEMLIRRAKGSYRGRSLYLVLDLRAIRRVGIDDTDLRDGTTSGPALGRAGKVNRGRVRVSHP